MHHDNRADPGGDRQHNGERAQNHRFVVDARCFAGEVRSTVLDLGFARRAHHAHLQRKHHEQMKRGIDETRAAPTHVLDHECAQRPADRAGETAEQCEIGDWPARLAAIHAAERGEDCIVKASCPFRDQSAPRPAR